MCEHKFFQEIQRESTVTYDLPIQLEFIQVNFLHVELTFSRVNFLSNELQFLVSSSIMQRLKEHLSYCSGHSHKK